VVGGEDAHDGFGIERVQDVGGEADGGGGVALGGLGQHLALGDVGQLAEDGVAEMLVGEDPEALGRNDRSDAVDGGLDEGAVADDVEDLLGGALTAARPEAGAATAGEDEAVMVGVHRVIEADSRG